ncbi:MAG: hypothetical protein J4F37_08815, partial [Acidobacteria bacterium]|nr:hypothetical protein [Acidobacteriota bacterium]
MVVTVPPDGLVPNSAGDSHAEAKARANIEVIAAELDLEYRRIVPGVELRQAARDNGADLQDDKIKSFVARGIMAEALDPEGISMSKRRTSGRTGGSLPDTAMPRRSLRPLRRSPDSSSAPAPRWSRRPAPDTGGAP